MLARAQQPQMRRVGALILGFAVTAMHYIAMASTFCFANPGNEPFAFDARIFAGVATVIASQAVISGAFSLTHQAVTLGFFPRVTIKHTSAREIGQVYVPVVNWLMMLATLGVPRVLIPNNM